MQYGGQIDVYYFLDITASSKQKQKTKKKLLAGLKGKRVKERKRDTKRQAREAFLNRQDSVKRY